MIACYDLSRCPPTYDAVAFLALAEMERRHRGDEHIEVVVLPGPVGGFRRDSLWPRSVEERVRLRDRVLVPLCRLLSSVSSVVVADRPGAAYGCWGKGEYYIGLPAIVRALRAGCRPLYARPKEWSVVPNLVTFTLREAAHHPMRNSQTAEWVAAAKVLIRRGLQVAMIRDTRMADAPLPGLLHSCDIATDLNARASVYSRAALNVGISNGPMWMSIFMDAPTLMLRPTTNEAGGCYDDAFFAGCGVRRGEQLPTSPPHQRLVWEDDTCDSIVRAVEDMLDAN